MHVRVLRYITCLFAVLVIGCVILVAGCGKSSGTTSGTAPNGAATTPGGTTPTTPSGQTQPGQTRPETQPSGSETSDVDSAGAAAVADAKASSPGLGDLQVLAVKIAGDWARVDMQPADGSADEASWLLRKVDGSWQVVDRGTTLLPADHPDAPPSVFQ